MNRTYRTREKWYLRRTRSIRIVHLLLKMGDMSRRWTLVLALPQFAFSNGALHLTDATLP